MWQHSKFSMFEPAKGNALTEYVLPMGLVLLMTAPLWSTVSNGYGGQLNKIFTQPVSSINNNNANNSKPLLPLGGKQIDMALPIDGMDITQQPIIETAGVTGARADYTWIVKKINGFVNDLQAKNAAPDLVDIVNRLTTTANAVIDPKPKSLTQLETINTDLKTIYNKYLDYTAINPDNTVGEMQDNLPKLYAELNKISESELAWSRKRQNQSSSANKGFVNVKQ